MAETPSEIETAIEANAQGPESASGDAGSMRQHSLADQIAADKDLAAKAASRIRRLPFRVVAINPGGMTR